MKNFRFNPFLSPHVEFLSDVTDLSPFLQIYEHTPGIGFFIKDIASRYLYANRQYLRHLSRESLEDIVEKTEYDFFPTEYCDPLLRDDELVLESNQPLIDRIGLQFNESNELDWFVTAKIPVFDLQEKIKGLFGVMSRCKKGDPVHEFEEGDRIRKLLKWLQWHQERKVTVREMEQVTKLSNQQLNHRLMEVFGVDAKEFELFGRIKTSSESLRRTEKAIPVLAAQFGFGNEGRFSEKFRSRIGMSPAEFRANRKAKGDVTLGC